MASFPPVEAVVRTLDILVALNRRPVVSLAFLHEQMGIPKPSIIRLLQTLESCGYVRHAPAPGAYYLTSKVKTLSSGYHSEPRIVEVLGPLLEELTAAIKWPAAALLQDGDAMVVRYSTIPNSPLALVHSTLNTRVNLFSTAAGRAYLAFCDDEEIDTLIAHAASTNPQGAPPSDRQTLHATLELVRRDGYALRDPRLDPLTRTLAVPVFDNTGIAAVIVVTWFTSAMKVNQAVERYFGLLRDIAERARVALSPKDDGAS